MKKICAARTAFPKPSLSYLKLYGPSVVFSEGADYWTRHRRIAYPAFAESATRRAFEQTVRIVGDMFDVDWSRGGKRVVVEDTTTSMTDVSERVRFGCNLRLHLSISLCLNRGFLLL